MDWRMPTQNELAGLYDAAKTYKSDCGYDVHLTELIRAIHVLGLGLPKRAVTRLPAFISTMAYGAGISNPTAASAEFYRCVLPDRLFVHLVLWSFSFIGCRAELFAFLLIICNFVSKCSLFVCRRRQRFRSIAVIIKSQSPGITLPRIFSLALSVAIVTN